MIQILVASRNGGKVKELAHLLQLDEIEFISMADAGLHDLEVDETGSTYEENAMLKAKTVGDLAGKITVADDSGIEVQALDNRPGVHSARYAKGSDSDRTRKLLKEMELKTNRIAKFVAVIAYYDPSNGEKHEFRGEVHGRLANQVRGEHGFGYDPIFIPDGYEQTMSEVGETVKNQISHRAKAVAAFKSWWISKSS